MAAGGAAAAGLVSAPFLSGGHTPLTMSLGAQVVPGLAPAAAVPFAVVPPVAAAGAGAVAPLSRAAWAASTAWAGLSSFLGGAIFASNTAIVCPCGAALTAAGSLTARAFSCGTFSLVCCSMKFTVMTLFTTTLFWIVTGPTYSVLANTSWFCAPNTISALNWGRRKLCEGTKNQSSRGASWLEMVRLTAKPSPSGRNGAQPT